MEAAVSREKWMLFADHTSTGAKDLAELETSPGSSLSTWDREVAQEYRIDVEEMMRSWIHSGGTERTESDIPKGHR